MTVITRFAPSPTGFLHIGGARTALFNWLYARHNKGKFLLRIEDTDRARSTQEATDAIYAGLQWLGLDWDDEPVHQFARADRHRAVALQLLQQGKAYHCYCSPEELDAMRETALQEGRQPGYNGLWRDRDPKDAPVGVKPVVRFKAPQSSELTIQDKVQGSVTVQCEQLDDMVLLRADGTPTYMLSVVVDDHDMGITDIIRGDDHLTNAFRQVELYNALGWDAPNFSHIPLIHGEDGAKLSKRHGALGVEHYRDLGILPEAMRNYLLRLGWSHGNDEIIPTDKAIEWFGLESVGKSPSRLDQARLMSTNSHYIHTADNAQLVLWLQPFIDGPLEPELQQQLVTAMDTIKTRAQNLVELASEAYFILAPGLLTIQPDAALTLTKDAQAHLVQIADQLGSLENWTKDTLEALIKTYLADKNLKFPHVGKPLRAALTGTLNAPGIYDLMLILGREKTLQRIKESAQN